MKLEKLRPFGGAGAGMAKPTNKARGVSRGPCSVCVISWKRLEAHWVLFPVLKRKFGYLLNAMPPLERMYIYPANNRDMRIIPHSLTVGMESGVESGSVGSEPAVYSSRFV